MIEKVIAVAVLLIVLGYVFWVEANKVDKIKKDRAEKGWDGMSPDDEDELKTEDEDEDEDFSDSERHD